MSEPVTNSKAVEVARFRMGMRKLAGAVTIITSVRGGQRHGMTATAVCSVTCEPPTLLVRINKSTVTLASTRRRPSSWPRSTRRSPAVTSRPTVKTLSSYSDAPPPRSPT